jgi:hypothetical protein
MVGGTRKETQPQFSKTMAVSVLLVLCWNEEERHNRNLVMEMKFWDIQEWIGLQIMKQGEL